MRAACLALLIAFLAACDGAPAPAPAPASGAAPVASTPPPAPAASATASPATGASAVATLPADVLAFREERGQCDHFRGEEPYDAKRAAELKKQLDRFCKGTDARLAALRSKYASQPAATAALKDFEDRVE